MLPGHSLGSAGLVARYHGIPLRTIDASAVVVADRLGATSIATLDRRDLLGHVMRPAHIHRFELLLS